MRNTVDILPLDEVKSIAQNSLVNVPYCHIYGVFLEENKSVWRLADESCPRGIEIQVNGDTCTYPKPKPGDIIRVHRLSFKDKKPIISHPNTVVMWKAFKYNPTEITTARSPTLTDEDTKRRRVLETFYSSILDKLVETKPGGFFNVCGRVEDFFLDKAKATFLINDGTGRLRIRCFKAVDPTDSNVHFETASSKLKIRDYIVATNVKYYSPKNTLDLSSNVSKGKSLRIVDCNSILGVRLSEALDSQRQEESKDESINHQQYSVNIQNPSQETTDSASTLPRRSPRLQQIAQLHQKEPNDSTESIVDATSSYTNIADIMDRQTTYINFYDIAGQVRGQPTEVKYANWIFQLYDGSRTTSKCWNEEDFIERHNNCATILVYSKQKENETDEHVEKVKKLTEGQLVSLKNVRASWKDSKLKLEMSANLMHGKSINLIDETSPLGIKLLEIVTNPVVDELVDEELYETPDAEISETI